MKESKKNAEKKNKSARPAPKKVGGGKKKDKKGVEEKGTGADKKISAYTFEETKERLFTMLEVYLDQHKEYALKSSMLEPMKFVYTKILNSASNAGSNDVHGSTHADIPTRCDRKTNERCNA
jgi:hypothetical protein